MWDSFVSSWPLFHDTYLAGLLIAVLLALIGVVVVARDQIFVGAAVSQASALGITVGMWIESWLGWTETSWYELDAVCSLFGGLFAILGAVVTAHPKAEGRETREAITGWVFLVAASAAVLLVAHSPHGMEEVHRLMTSTLIGATAADVRLFAVLLAATLVAVSLWRGRLILLLMDAEMAQAVGTPVGAFNLVLHVWLGMTIALALQVSGMVYALGCLVLPALAAKSSCRELGQMLWASPLIALAASLAGFVIANHFDFPPAHVAVAILAAVVGLAWTARWLGARC